MSLRVWLPLNGDLHNLGLSNVTVTNNGATVNTSGKIGSCYSFGTATSEINLSSNAMTSMTTECSVSFWLKIISWNSNYATFFQAGTGSASWAAHYFSFLRNASNSTCCFTISNGSSNSSNSYLTSALELNTWYHIGLIYKTGHCLIYINGELYRDYTTSIVPNFSGITVIKLGRSHNTYQTNCLMNDFRIYDHALSVLEVKEIARGLVLHYPLNHNGMGNENLFRGSAMTQEDLDNMVVNNSTSFGETKYFRYYNGSKSNHSFSNGIDTVTLNAASNLGIAFMRPAVDIDLDSNSYYTISCRAKCTKAGAGLDIGLSYRTTADAWVWRGGSNRQLFNAVNQWLTFTLTFKPDADTKYICYCFTVLGVKNGTDTFSIKECKLEKGEIATRWALSSLDSLYNSEIYESVVEYDTSGYRNNGTKVGTFTYSTDTPKYGVSTSFDGTTNCILVPYNTICPDNIFTFNLWFKKDDLGSKSYETLFGGPSGFEMDSRQNNQSTLSLYMASTRSGKRNLVTELTFNTWYMVTMVRDGIKERYYINGIFLSEIDAKPMPTGIYRIGAWASNTGQNYYGNISDFRIYATALSAQDILSLYHNSALVDELGIIHGAIH